jgi:hypothetical protein
MFSPVETQVIFLSKETPIVSVGLRTAGNKTVRHQDISVPLKKSVKSAPHFLRDYLFKNKINEKKIKNFNDRLIAIKT